MAYLPPITLLLILQWHTGVCEETFDVNSKNFSNIARYLKFDCQKVEFTRNGKLRRLSGRFQTVPGSQIVGKTRKSRASENGGGAGKKGKGGERERVIISKRPSSAASPSPQFPPVFFLFRAFSIPRARLSRSLVQAKFIL